MARAPYREKLKVDTIAIARRVIADEGLAALQARRIAKEAGCSVGTIYNLYDNLDDLIVVANAGTLDDLGVALTNELDQSAGHPFADRLVGLGLAYLHFASTHETSWRAVFEHHLAPGATVPNWYRDRQARLFQMVEGVMADHEIAVADPSMSARALFGAVHGIVSLALDQKLGDFNLSVTEQQVRFVVGAAAQQIGQS